MAYTTINKGSDYFNTVLYTGDGNTTKAITGVGFEPDFIWIKDRDSTAGHTLQDIVRGFGSSTKLASYTNDAEDNSSGGTWGNYGYVTSADSDGFTVNEGANTPSQTNTNTNDYVSWSWLAGGTASSNTDGSETTSVSANTTSGFSIVSYTGTGTNDTFGHGLGVKPSMIITKSRDTNGLDWRTYHASLGATKYVTLNLTTGETTESNFMNNTEPTTSVFTLSTGVTPNKSGDAYIAYCFAEKKGFSKIGSYTGNISTDGTFVYTGFKPAFILLKHSNATGNSWRMFDNKRLGYNVDNYPVNANTSSAESSPVNIDLLSNGFKFRTISSAMNDGEYIYMCFAENPFVTSTGIPATAR